MSRFQWIAGAVAFAALLTVAFAADWGAIGRTIRKQLVSKSKPKYALLLFGKEAKTRVWVVEDSETLYVDRNADGDLTEKGRTVHPDLVGKKQPIRISAGL